MTTISSATRFGRGLPVPGAFPRASAWSAARIDGANAARGAAKVNGAATQGTTAGINPILGQAAAQPTHMYMDKARVDAVKRDAMGSQPRRAPV